MTTRICIGLTLLVTALTACRPAPDAASSNGGPAVPGDGAAAPRAAHPLDPLTPDEIRTAIQTARSDARLAGAAFPSVSVHEPPKADVLGWQRGQPLARHARLQAMTADRTYEVVVDVAEPRMASIVERPGAEPSITLSEIEATKVVLSNTEFKEGLQKRGVTDLTKVFCAPFSAGYYGNPAHDGKRLVKSAASTRAARPPICSAGPSSVCTPWSISARARC